MSVKHRLLVMVAITVIMLAMVMGVALYRMSHLADFQDDGFTKTQTHASAVEASWLGAQFYQVFADTIINRDIAEAKKDFAAINAEAKSDLQRLAEVADTPEERAAVAAASKDVEAIVVLFEKRLLPALNDDNKVDPAIHAIDDEADATVARIREQMAKVAESMGREALDADKHFDEERSRTLIEIALVAVAAAIAMAVYAGFVLRSILKPLQVVQEAAERIAKGDLTHAFEVDGRDELAKVLAPRRGPHGPRPGAFSMPTRRSINANTIHRVASRDTMAGCSIALMSACGPTSRSLFVKKVFALTRVILIAGMIGSVAPAAFAADAAVKTVAAVYQEKAALSGNAIQVSGKVVKVNNGIMGRNFVHVRDGSGEEGSNNLIVTSKDTAAVGDEVVVTGNVKLDRDFGSGYLYPLLVEDATIAKK